MLIIERINIKGEINFISTLYYNFKMLDTLRGFNVLLRFNGFNNYYINKK